MDEDIVRPAWRHAEPNRNVGANELLNLFSHSSNKNEQGIARGTWRWITSFLGI